MSSALADSVWTVDLRTGRVLSSRAITVPGYEAPALPEDELRGMEELTKWASAQMRAATIEGDGELLVVPFNRGRYWTDNERGLAAVRAPNSEWLAIAGMPVVFRSRGRRVFTLQRPDLERIVIGVFEWREN